jgi:hypothetical protein
VNQSNRRPVRPTWGRFVLSLVLPPLLAILLMPGTSMGDSPSLRQASSDSAALLEGVVLSPRHGFAYVMRPGGGLAAVNLANGKVRWRSDNAKPVALVGDRLIAQVEGKGKALELVALDARSGAVRDSVRIPLPAGVSATLVDTAKGSFRVQASGVGSELLVRWEATGFGAPAQGYLPAASEGQALAADAPTVMAGEAVLDATSLAVKAEPSVRASHSAVLSRASLEELSAPAVAGGKGRQMLSADGRHVLVTEPVDAAEFTLYRHRWTIYERATGTRLGSVQAMVSANPFVVVGNTLYHTVPAHAVRKDGKFVENPTALRAVNLKAGVEAWKMALLETDFRGPFPP